MKTKSYLLTIWFLFLFWLCNEPKELFAQSATLSTVSVMENAIRDVSDYLNTNIPEGSSIVFLSISSESVALSDIIINDLITNAVNDRIFTVVDRQRLNEIRAEQAFQLSGDVNDETAVSIGNFLGASAIILGEVYTLGGQFRLTVRALDVETAKIQAQYNKNIGREIDILTMIGIERDKTTPITNNLPSKPASFVYKVGDTGPAGGIIFFDKGEFYDGWRYLEAAPRDSEFSAQWSVNTKKIKGTKKRIGTGKSNTEIIIDFLNKIGETGNAAQLCVELNIEGYNDWFLPSIDELDLMYQNLVKSGLLYSFRKDIYWSSSENNSLRSCFMHFSGGYQFYTNKTNTNWVRAIRAF